MINFLNKNRLTYKTIRLIYEGRTHVIISNCFKTPKLAWKYYKWGGGNKSLCDSIYNNIHNNLLKVVRKKIYCIIYIYKKKKKSSSAVQCKTKIQQYEPSEWHKERNLNISLTKRSTWNLHIYQCVIYFTKIKQSIHQRFWPSTDLSLPPVVTSITRAIITWGGGDRGP